MYKVIYRNEEGKKDEFNRNGLGFTYENAKRLMKLLRSCGYRPVVVALMEKSHNRT